MTFCQDSYFAKNIYRVPKVIKYLAVNVILQYTSMFLEFYKLLLKKIFSYPLLSSYVTRIIVLQKLNGKNNGMNIITKCSNSNSFINC